LRRGGVRGRGAKLKKVPQKQDFSLNQNVSRRAKKEGL
jgi:hypothetical protein